MNSQDIQNLQESYLAVYDDETRENLEFENWVNNLLDEGYDLSSYTWDEMAEIYIDEAAAEGVRPYRKNKLQPLPEPKPLSGERGDGSGYGDAETMKDWKLNATPSTIDRKGRTVSQRMNDENPYKNRLMGPLGREQGSRISSEVTRVIKGTGEPRATVSLAPKGKKKASKKKASKEIVRKTKNESYDLYDVILSHLIDEGYADTFESAEAIMVNMSEDWRESIIEEVLDEGYVDYKKGKLPSGRTPQQAAQGRSELLNARERNRPLDTLDGTWGRQQNQDNRTKQMDKLTAGNPVSRAVRRGLGDMLPGGQPNTDRHFEAMGRRNRVADIESAEKKSRGK